MNSKQLLYYLIFYGPIALIIGIMCTVAYSFEFETSVSINWPIAVLIGLVIVGISIVRDRQDQQKSDQSPRHGSKP